jgi:dTDP-4-dehydrorhamnose reductase
MNLSAIHYPILVTGAAGQLGHAMGPRLARMAPRPESLRLTDVRELQLPGGGDVHALDITDPAAVLDAVRTFRPRTVFNLAAWTNVDGAEARPDDARRLNADAPDYVARAAAEAGALMVHVSTDFVFDGLKPGLYREDDPPTPQSVYGVTKAEGEERVRAAAPDRHLVVRTAWLYGAGGKNFILAILAAAGKGGPLRVVADQVGCPTWTEDLAEALLALVESGSRGTFHACGAGEASRWEQAVEVVRAAGLNVAVEKSATIAKPGVATRPVRAVLSTEKLTRATGYRFPPWQESLRAYVRQVVSAAPRG